MDLSYIALIAFIIIIYAGPNFYIGWRGWRLVARLIPNLKRKIYWTIFWFVALAYFIGVFIEEYLPGIVSKPIIFLGAYWMGAAVYILLFMTIADIIGFTADKLGLIARLGIQRENMHFMLSLISASMVFAVLAYGTWNAKNVQLVRYNITIPKAAGSLKELRIAMVSDIHLGRVINKKRLDELVDRLNSLKPDMVVIAGDIIDEKLKPLVEQRMWEELGQLNSKYGTFACLGNHEFFGGRVDDKIKFFTRAGVNILADTSIKIAGSFYLVGRYDKSIEDMNGNKRMILSELMNTVDKTFPIILLEHRPIELDAAQKEGVDLQLSGHTHAGQFFPINLLTDKIFEVDWGCLKKGSLNVIVSSGFGTWGPPIRTANHPEVIEINIKFKGAD